MFTLVGNCPKCGAPIYAPTVWGAVIPPPNRFTCACYPQMPLKVTTKIEEAESNR